MRPRFRREVNSTSRQINGSGGIEIYTGEGKGKSTSALGKALQAIGKGISQDKSHRVLILQWLKGGNGYTEDAAIEALRDSYPHLVDHLRSGEMPLYGEGSNNQLTTLKLKEHGKLLKRLFLVVYIKLLF